jgi:hypothetical protein
MSSPTITVRQLGPNHDPVWGSGQSNFISDLAAVEQIIGTRLLLFQGEWWTDLTDGLPLWQSILSQPGSQQSQQQIASVITARIQGTPYVITVNGVGVIFNPQTRTYYYSATVNTQFGQVPLVNFSIPATTGALI